MCEKSITFSTIPTQIAGANFCLGHQGYRVQQRWKVKRPNERNPLPFLGIMMRIL